MENTSNPMDDTSINPYFDEHFNGIVYTANVGFGFTAADNKFAKKQMP